MSGFMMRSFQNGEAALCALVVSAAHHANNRLCLRCRLPCRLLSADGERYIPTAAFCWRRSFSDSVGYLNRLVVAVITCGMHTVNNVLLLLIKLNSVSYIGTASGLFGLLEVRCKYSATRSRRRRRSHVFFTQNNHFSPNNNVRILAVFVFVQCLLCALLVGIYCQELLFLSLQAEVNWCTWVWGVDHFSNSGCGLKEAIYPSIHPSDQSF